MSIRRSLNQHGSLQVAERWRDGVRTFEAWWTFQPGRVGHGETREQAIRNIPPRRSTPTERLLNAAAGASPFGREG